MVLWDSRKEWASVKHLLDARQFKFNVSILTPCDKAVATLSSYIRKLGFREVKNQTRLYNWKDVEED